MNITRNELTMSGAVLASFVVISAALLANYQSILAGVYPYDSGKGDYKFGTISSVQNDQNGNPAWVLVGHWKSNLASNQSIIGSQGNETSGGGSFDAQFEMVRLNGSAGHTHTITSFAPSNSSQINNFTVMYNGTATASLREGPVTDIPTSISIMGNKVISIWLDPSKVDNHYGNTPVYGLVMDDHEGRQGLMKFNSTQFGK
jgi:hypothetical protein